MENSQCVDLKIDVPREARLISQNDHVSFSMKCVGGATPLLRSVSVLVYFKLLFKDGETSRKTNSCTQFAPTDVSVK